MGKIRVKTVGDEEQEALEAQKKAVKKAEKKARLSAAEFTDNDGQAREAADAESEESTEASSPIEESANEQVETVEEAPKEAKKPKKEKFVKVKQRSANYTAKIIQIDKNKTYSLADGIDLLKKVKMTKFDETVELHINTTEAGISGTVVLPHGSGKEVRVAIASEEIIAEVEKGKVNFDILVAEPAMMPKLAKVARVLGPKGLMPNPKNGTISSNPEEAAKKFQGGQMSFKTESKLPVMHLIAGKTSFEDKALAENITTILKTIKKDKIRKVVLKSTMSPAILIQA